MAMEMELPEESRGRLLRPAFQVWREGIRNLNREALTEPRNGSPGSGEHELLRQVAARQRLELLNRGLEPRERIGAPGPTWSGRLPRSGVGASVAPACRES
jgi:hypothetical protein